MLKICEAVFEKIIFVSSQIVGLLSKKRQQEKNLPKCITEKDVLKMLHIVVKDFYPKLYFYNETYKTNTAMKPFSTAYP